MLTLALAAYFFQNPYAGWTVHHLLGLKRKPVKLCLPSAYKLDPTPQLNAGEVDYTFSTKTRSILVSISPGPDKKQAAWIVNNVMRKPPSGAKPIGSSLTPIKVRQVEDAFDHDYWVSIGVQSRFAGADLIPIFISCHLTPLRAGGQTIDIDTADPPIDQNAVTQIQLAASWFISHNPVKH